MEEDRILKINIESEMKSAYIDYSMSVIVSRALPDVRDGLKPVHRRVLYSMNEMGNTSSHSYRKSAKCVGDVMGNYHPHGDAAIYDTVVRLARPWAMRYTLVDGHGNFGSVDGDGAAAPRYTEVRLRRIGEEMLSDIDEDTVDFQPNYDNSRQEPTVLPSRFPNLLVNGATGIAVGMATNIPTHNLTECMNGAIALVDNPEMTVSDLMEYIKAPDFPTGGIIYGYQGVRDAFETGRGRIIIRGRAEIETEDNHDNIVITEIPYNVNKALLCESIAELAKEKKIDGIVSIHDFSNSEGMRIVVRLKSDANSNVVLNKLYKMSALQSSFSVNNVVLCNGRPRTLNLKQILEAFVAHRHDVVTRRTQFRLKKAQDRLHILEGLIIASDHIQEVIDLIRASADPEAARAALNERFGLTAEQAAAIVAMRLGQLTGLEQAKLHNEADQIHITIDELQLILNDDHVCRELIKSELIETRDKFGDPRLTEIDYTAGDFNAEDFYSDDDMIITISHLGYIKRTPLSEFRAQNRGGVGAKGSDTRDEDFIEHIYTASMHSSMLFFTRMGRCYWLKVYELPEGAKNAKGRAIQNLLNIDPEDAVRAYIAVKGLNDEEFVKSHNLVFCTRQGVIKKTSLEAYSHPRAKGVNAIIVREGDELLDVKLTDGNSQIMLANRAGYAIRFEEQRVRPMGRVSTGVRGMRHNGPEDDVVGMICMEPDSANTVMVLSENGYGKRTELDAYRVTNRGGKGVKTINVTERTGALIAIESVNDDNDLVIINRSGITLRVPVCSIGIKGRATQGMRIINLQRRRSDTTDTIASVCCVDSDPEEEVDADIIDNQAEELPEIVEDITEEPDVEPDDDLLDDEPVADDPEL